MTDEQHPPHQTEMAIGDAWEDMILGEPAGDPETTAVVRDMLEGLAAIDQVPALTSARRARIWQEVLASAAIATAPHPPVTLPVSDPVSPNGHRPGMTLPVAPLSTRSSRLITSLPVALLVVLGVALMLLANAGGLQRGAVRVGDPTVLPAIADRPVAFVWESRGGLGRLQTPDSMQDQTLLVDPYHLAIDPHGNIWVPDSWSSRFQILAPDGSLIQTWGNQGHDDGEFHFFNVGMDNQHGAGAAAFDAEGNLYVADPGNFRIQKFAPDLTFLTAWGSKGDGPGQFLGLTDLAVDRQGTIYVLDALRADVQVFEATGTLLRSWGESGVNPGQFLSPYGLAASAEGTVVVADTGNHRVQVFSPEGAVQSAWGGMGTDDAQFRQPDDVAIDAQGRVFVTDTSNNRVQMLDAQGALLWTWGERGSAPGQFITPTGIALDEMGHVYVSEAGDGNERVQKFRLLPPWGPG
jgi:DNA-binding beta-propeller fold protein YncE